MRQAEEVLEQGGFRNFVIAVLLAVLVGVLVRLTLSPPKIEKLVRSKIEASDVRDNLTFEGAEISLADGWLPSFALVLNRVEWRLTSSEASAAAGCSSTSPVRARAVRIPLRFASLFTGNVAVGRIAIDELTVDLDDLNRKCAGASATTVANILKPEVAASAKADVANAAGDAQTTPLVQPVELWSTEDQVRISSMIRGVRVARAEIFFENRMKSVILEDALISWRGADLDVSTSLRFPPSTVFGENLPTFSIRGTAHQREMNAEIRAELSEGTLEANAVFKPVQTASGTRELDADLKLAVSDLPLSVVTPVLSKSKILTGTFRPKFMWLDCNAEVHGLFSRLFVDNAVSLSQCEISGQVGRLNLASATRLPSGAWKPFEVVAEKLDIARVFETFDLQGPVGVFANFGQLSGKLQLNSPHSAEADAKIEGAVIRFAGGDGTALQPLTIGSVHAALDGGRWKLGLKEFTPEGGVADLQVTASMDEAGRDAEVDIQLKQLKLHTRVEKVIFTGPVSNISGAAAFAFGTGVGTEGSKLTRLKAALDLREMRGSDIEAQEVNIEASLPKAKGDVEVSAKSNAVETLKSGRLFRLLEPALLGWSGQLTGEPGDRLRLDKVAIKGRFRDNGFQWQAASAQVTPSMRLFSHGHIYRDHAVDAELEANYPLASRLKWNVAGTWLKPKFSAASAELGALFAKAGLPRETVVGVVPPRLLGLPKTAAEDASVTTEKPQATSNPK